MIHLFDSPNGKRVVVKCDHCGAPFSDYRVALVIWSPLDGWFPAKAHPKELLEQAGMEGLHGKRVFLGRHPYMVHEGFCDGKLRETLQSEADQWMPLGQFVQLLIAGLTLEKIDSGVAIAADVEAAARRERVAG